MSDILKALTDTPLPSILVIGGIAFLFFAFMRRAGTSIETDPSQKGWMILTGLILLVGGVILYIIPVLVTPNPQTPAFISPTETAAVLATQTDIVQQTEISDCDSKEFTPPTTGIHPPVDTLICVPSGYIVWISSDPSQFSIPSIDYNKTFNMGYTFMLFGPVKFKVSGVQSNYIWMDTRTNTSLMGNLDGKTLNLIYQDGKVCDFALYAGTACP